MPNFETLRTAGNLLFNNPIEFPKGSAQERLRVAANLLFNPVEYGKLSAHERLRVATEYEQQYYRQRPFEERGRFMAPTPNNRLPSLPSALSSDHVALVRKWLPGFKPGHWPPKDLERLLLWHFNLAPETLRQLTWLQTIEFLETQPSPASAISGSNGELPAPAKPIDPANEVDDDSVLSPKQLAERWGILSKIGALQSRLKRWREQTPDGNGTIWVEVADPKPRDPRYLYRVGPIRSMLDNLKTTSERRAKRTLLR
jgi:hypothetical protein